MITNENYYACNNKGLSQSKTKDYILDPNYCYRKNIAGTLEKEEKDCWKVGSAVDDILTEKDSVENYAIFEGDRRTKDGKEDYQILLDSGKKIITKPQYEQIINIADAVVNTEAYKEIHKNFIFQDILSYPMSVGAHFDCLYGKPDAYKIDENGVCRLVDIKTSMVIDDKQFYYKAQSFGYFKQLWFYQYLLGLINTEIKKFEYYIFAVETKEPYRTKLFRIPSEYIEREGQIMLETIDKISKDKEFKKIDASFNNPTLLLDPRDYGSEMEVEEEVE